MFYERIVDALLEYPLTGLLIVFILGNLANILLFSLFGMFVFRMLRPFVHFTGNCHVYAQELVEMETRKKLMEDTDVGGCVSKQNMKELPVKSGWIHISTTYSPEEAESEVVHPSSGSQRCKTPDSTIMQNANGTERYLKFAVLKMNTLFLYESDITANKNECLGISFLESCVVDLMPPDIKKEHRYKKRHPIRIYSPKGAIFNRSDTCYLYCINAYEKEDWYLLLKKSIKEGVETEKDPKRTGRGVYFKKLVAEIRSPRFDQSSQWLNALVNRIFYNISESSKLENYVLKMVNKKLSKMKKPFFLNDVCIKKVRVGNKFPLFNNINLHDMKDTGELTISTDVYYNGGLKFRVETEAKFDFPKMKPITISLVLSVTVRKIAGRLLLKIKTPPTDRVWLGFYALPTMDLLIEPIVSTKAIKWSMFRSVIEKKIKDATLESLVLPNMEDLLIPDYSSKYENENPNETYGYFLKKPSVCKNCQHLYIKEGILDRIQEQKDIEEDTIVSKVRECNTELDEKRVLQDRDKSVLSQSNADIGGTKTIPYGGRRGLFKSIKNTVNNMYVHFTTDRDKRNALSRKKTFSSVSMSAEALNTKGRIVSEGHSEHTDDELSRVDEDSVDSISSAIQNAMNSMTGIKDQYGSNSEQMTEDIIHKEVLLKMSSGNGVSDSNDTLCGFIDLNNNTDPNFQKEDERDVFDSCANDMLIDSVGESFGDIFTENDTMDTLIEHMKPIHPENIETPKNCRAEIEESLGLVELFGGRT